MSSAHRPLELAWVGVAALVVVSCGSPSEHSEPLPADQLVFSVGSSGHGWTPYVVEAIRSPVISVYGDGRVVFTGRNEPATMAPPEYLVVQADPDDVARFADELEGQYLIDLGTDVGSPGVTDQATTTITFHGRGDASELRVYAFGTRFERDLPSSALENREALRGVIEGAWDLAEGDAEPYDPDTVHVHAPTAGTAPDDDVPSWPGPDPATFMTGDPGSPGVITGDAAAVVYTAARENPDAWWRTDDEVVRLVVDPVP
ncbi:hypothetical protein EV641_101150 [Rhodococcus sp. SMB37]|uniref:hypothetical protein n=1 Tax=Rhodococcus sp. SMB37 TaxID=2512213 RepID=UPI0006D21698|nr:hypothetical protein [Rhodococcus sp. SMB37]TCN58055.1 hypothetical protein EV641_101150 [Rhodococcus sp. SMB37]